MEVASLDLSDAAAFQPLAKTFDTVICLNVLEHIADDLAGFRNIHGALEPGGKAIVVVPQGKHLFCSLDRVLGHVKRYDRGELIELMQRAGFVNIQVRDFNKFGVPGWYLNGRLLKRDYFPRVQLKLYNMLTPVISRIDAAFPWHGLSLVATGEKPLPR
jgi:SAM-dependent methyltransferase